MTEAKHISMATSWRVRCGIATFSDHLASAYASHGRRVYINRIQRWGQKHPGYFNWLAARTPDAAQCCVVQHEYGLFQGREVAFYDTLAARKVPTVTEMHSTGFTKLDQVVLGHSDKVIVHNDYCKAFLPRNNKTVVLPHPVPRTDKLWPVEKARESLSLPPDKKIVLIFGFVTEAKGHDVAIRAVSKMPDDIILLVAGGWHLAQPTEFHDQMTVMSAKLLGSRGLWLGYIPGQRLIEVFSAADMVLMPYTKITESGALMTALGYGKAVLGSPLKPFLEKEGMGVLNTYPNEDELPGAIVRVLGDDKERRRLEKAARRFARENSYRKVAAKHLELIDSVVTQN